MLVSLATQPFSRISEDQKLSANTRQTQKSCLQLPSTMSGQTSGGEAGPPSRSNQRTFLDDVVLTFSSPMAWLLVVALVLTWSGVAIVLFDLLDYKTLADYTSYCDDPVCLSPDNVRDRRPGLPPPPAIAKRGLRARAALRSLKPSPAGVHGDITPQESDDWLEMIWSFAASLVAPDEEEEAFGSEEL
ncbi:triadin isoform X3 [Poecilia formosa]|uniref:triadin isoform X3 n=1 Tax=Poecilia formosa TaxID=48698 RepID=UPI0007B9B8BE|nr:PREDICTED: triadin isoform X3 [Poecilia formosa]